MPTLLRPWLAYGAAAGIILLTAGMAATRTSAQGSCAVSVNDLTVIDEERTVIRLLNEYRGQHGVAALAVNQAANRTAAWHARDMAAKDYFSHNPPDRSWFQMTRDCGMRSSAGENIGAGYGSAASVMQAWVNSPDHDANMLRTEWRSIGVGVATGPGVYGTYWVQEFSTEPPDGGATPTAQVTPPPTPTPTPVTQTVLQVWVQRPDGQWTITDIDIPPWCLWHAVKTRGESGETVVRLFQQECP